MSSSLVYDFRYIHNSIIVNIYIYIYIIKDDINDDQELYNYLYNTLGKSWHGEIYMCGHIWSILQVILYCNIYIYIYIIKDDDDDDNNNDDESIQLWLVRYPSSRINNSRKCLEFSIKIKHIYL